MASRKIITLSLYNRPGYTVKVLDSLQRCEGIKDYVIVPIIDKQEGTNNQEFMRAILLKFAKSGLPVDLPRFHEDNVGCNANIYTCLNIGFQFTDFLIHVEDDIVLAKDALKYFEWADKQYKDDKEVFTVDAYNNEQHDTFPSAYEIKRSQSFKPWGWGTWVDRWEGIKDRWQFGFEPRRENGQIVFEGGGWDVCMKKLLRGDRYRIYPRIARCLNIGAIGGAHTPSEKFHHDKHDIKVWFDNLPENAEGDYYESR
jgi:hypothetical protein